MKRCVVLTGAGISAESGLQTFRGAGGLWEGHRIEDVATPEAFIRNPKLVLDFYNQRRKQLSQASPNAAHIFIRELEAHYDVQVITQNVDNLHERAGSQKVLHLHGRLDQVRSIARPDIIYPWQGDLGIEDKDEWGSPLRPHIVWFGEEVPEIVNAARLCSGAEIMVIIGTSLQVYPAASLMHYARNDCPILYVDPSASLQIPSHLRSRVQCIDEKASDAIPMVKKLMGIKN